MMKFAIPSFQRASILQERTINYLLGQGIDPQTIYVFVREDDKDINEYISMGYLGFNIFPLDIKGIGETHNYITHFFKEDEFICELDDDLIDVIDKDRNSVRDFLAVLEEMKEKMITENINYAGFYQCDNPKFMSGNQQYTTDLRYMLGLMRLRRIKKDVKLITNYAEDFENCLRYFVRDGKILKNNWIAGKTKNYADGGCNGDGRGFDSERVDKEKLAEEFPMLCRLFQRKNGRWDLRLKEYARPDSKIHNFKKTL
jgi:hypothetical protein